LVRDMVTLLGGGKDWVWWDAKMNAFIFSARTDFMQASVATMLCCNHLQAFGAVCSYMFVTQSEEFRDFKIENVRTLAFLHDT
jgi:hypothetical protein